MPKIMFFDLETTGLPTQKKGDKFNRYHHPSLIQHYDSSRIVSMAWQIYDVDTINLLSEENHIVYPDNFESQPKALAVHGITNEKAKMYGKNIQDIFDIFKKELKTVSLVSGFNVSFDYHVLLSECYRYGDQDIILKLQKTPIMCTQKLATKTLKNVSYCKYKLFPKLEEVYRYLFNDKDFNTSHDALDDTKRCAEIYFKLRSYPENNKWMM